MDDFEVFFLKVLAQLALIIVAARIGGWLALKLRQPVVVGEIAAGLVLGPSLLGRIWPGGLQSVFSPETSQTLHVFSELGLVLLMFLVGLEFDFSLLRRVGSTSMRVALAGLVLPLTMGLGLAWWAHPRIAPDVDPTGFMLIVAVAMSITAIPILGRIMIEIGLHKTPLGVLTITAAAIDDVAGWLLLACVSGVLQGDFSFWQTGRMVLLIAAFCLLVILVVRPWMARWSVGATQGGDADSVSIAKFSVVLALVLLSAMATNAIGIFSVFGPFVLGAAISDQRWFHHHVAAPLRPVVYALFLPVFFTYTGLRTDVGTLATTTDWLMMLLFLAVAVGGKFGGCAVAARWSGLEWRQSASVAVMMNTRALMGLIAINIGRNLGVVPDRVFTILVLVALLTTVMTMPLLRRFLFTELSQASYPTTKNLRSSSE